MKSTNNKGFTLVELIIVITILAILATVAFLALSGYSQEARDSGKMSEVSEIVKKITIDQARNSDTLDKLCKSSTGCTETHGSGVLNLAKLGMNSKNEYAFAYNTGGYLIAAKMDKYGTEQAGVYDKTNSGSYFVSGTLFLSGTTNMNAVDVGSGTSVTLDTFFGTTLPKK